MIAQAIRHRSSPPECRAVGVAAIARARRAASPRLKYIDHPSFDDPTARDAILAPLTHTIDDQVSRAFQSRDVACLVSGGPLRPTFLSREQEAHLFRKMNFLKCRANQLEEQLDPDRPDPGDLDEIERLRCEALAVKNRIVEMHLRIGRLHRQDACQGRLRPVRMRQRRQSRADPGC